MRIGILIPSRDRPELLRTAIASVRATSRSADCLVYIDDDQRDLYQSIEDEESKKYDGRVIFHHGSQVGPVASANAMAKENPGYSWFGIMTDDMEMMTKGWDEWLLARSELVVSPLHDVGLGTHVDVPFVRQEWVKRLGWFAYPGCYHNGWPTVIGVLGESLGSLVKAGQDEFFIRHTMKESLNQEHTREDAKQLYYFFQARFSAALSALRGA